MTWIDTPESSNIARFGYDDESRELRVEFKNGATYGYYDLPSTIFESMKAAPSKGQFLAQNVKGRYRYSRL